jgi:hypothetical protein
VLPLVDKLVSGRLTERMIDTGFEVGKCLEHVIAIQT